MSSITRAISSRWLRTVPTSVEELLLPVIGQGTYAPRRWNSALAEVLPESDETEMEPLHSYRSASEHSYNGHEGSVQSEVGNAARAEEQRESMSEHERRLSEMSQADHRRTQKQGRMLPSAEETLQRLQSHRAAGCSGQAQPAARPEQSAVLDWREVVEGLRLMQRQTPLSGPEMLTDSFG